MTITEKKPCDLCGSDLPTPRFSHALESGTVIQVVSCGACGLLYTHPRPTRDELVPLYQKTYVDIPGKSAPSTVRSMVVRNRVLRSIWHRIAGQCMSRFLSRARGRVLDVGCGTGDLLVEVVARGCSGFGVELNPQSVAKCRGRGLHVTCGGLEDIDESIEPFDTIVFWHSLEHLPSPRSSLQRAARLLAPNGRIFVYAPNAHSYTAALFGPSWVGWHLPFHFTHFTLATLRAMVGASGLQVAQMRTVTAEFLIGNSLHVWAQARGGAMQRLALRGAFGTPLFRAAIIPAIRMLDAFMPGRGENLFAEITVGAADRDGGASHFSLLDSHGMIIDTRIPCHSHSQRHASR
jgi:2-polyprenyl-3-methyl-5-hydroxy-6-metoxy-1,4-benzoquinol methylase